VGKKTSIYLTDEIRAKLRCPPRGASAAVSETIERYDALIAPARKRIESLFTPGEWDAMRSACNGTAWIAATIRDGVLHDIQDSLDAELSSFGAERSALEGKLAALGPTEQFALVEAIEGFWESIADAGEEPED